MGLYRVVLEATGGHGCQREVGDGGTVYGCRRQDCPDCVTQEYIEKMKKIGQYVSKAELVHWPDAANWGGESVVDEFVGGGTPKIIKETINAKDGLTFDVYLAHDPIRRIRHGNFPK